MAANLKLADDGDETELGCMPAWNKEILAAMHAELQREAAKCSNDVDANAMAMHVVAKWSVRSARLYGDQPHAA